MRVLAVDDNPMTGILLQDMLTDLGHEPFIAGGADQAMAMFEKYAPQICVLDWMMPGRDGLELACAIRQHKLGNAVYIIMLSAQDDVERIGLAYDLGVDDFVVKPVAPGELRARLRTAARLVSLQEQLAEKCQRIAALTRQIDHAPEAA
jgi:DNA-binding response OmpR family regulator